MDKKVIVLINQNTLPLFSSTPFFCTFLQTLNMNTQQTNGVSTLLQTSKAFKWSKSPDLLEVTADLTCFCAKIWKVFTALLSHSIYSSCLRLGSESELSLFYPALFCNCVNAEEKCNNTKFNTHTHVGNICCLLYPNTCTVCWPRDQRQAHTNTLPCTHTCPSCTVLLTWTS